jgi:hypothetical protein
VVVRKVLWVAKEVMVPNLNASLMWSNVRPRAPSSSIRAKFGEKTLYLLSDDMIIVYFTNQVRW